MTKRLDATGYETDKALHTHYLRSYEQYFDKLQDKEVRVLELGVYKGGSLLLWRDYFQKGLIVGVDLNPIQIDDPSGRIRTFTGQQHDISLLDRLAAETAPGGFDVIIDDCSHIGELTRISFWHLFENHLKPGGLYVIEDWSTGYWDSWFDGVNFQPERKNGFSPGLFRLRSLMARLYRSTPAARIPFARKFIVGLKRIINGRQFRSHDYGLVGFIKELVDECGMADITRPDFGRPPQLRSRFQEMRISAGQVFIVKASDVLAGTNSSSTGLG